MLCDVVCSVSMANEEVTDMEFSEQVQKAPRRRKCKNHLAQLAEMFPYVTYHVAAAYGSPGDEIYVMEVNIEGQVVVFFILFVFFLLLNPLVRCCFNKAVIRSTWWSIITRTLTLYVHKSAYKHYISAKISIIALYIICIKLTTIVLPFTLQQLSL